MAQRILVAHALGVEALHGADEEDLVVHRQAEQRGEHHQRHVARDRHGAVRRVDTDQVEAPAPLETRRQDAERRGRGQQVRDRRLQRDQQRAEGEQEQQEAEGDHDQDHLRQLRGDQRGEIDVAGGRTPDVGDHARRERRWDRVVPQLLHEVGCRARRRTALGDHTEDHRVALLVDHRLDDALDVGGLRQRVLQLHDARIRAALIAAGLRHLGGQLILEGERLLLLGLGSGLLLLERVGLLRQRVGLLLQHGLLLLQARGLRLQRRRLLLDRCSLSRNEVRLRGHLGGALGEVLLLLGEHRRALRDARGLRRGRRDRLLQRRIGLGQAGLRLQQRVLHRCADARGVGERRSDLGEIGLQRRVLRLERCLIRREVRDLRVEHLAAGAEPPGLARQLPLLEAQPRFGLAHTDGLPGQRLGLRRQRRGLRLECIGLLLELRLLGLERVGLRRQRLLLLLEAGLHRLGLVVLLGVLRARLRHRIERDGDHERAVVAGPETVRDHVEGLTLGRLECRRADVLLPEHQREDGDDHHRQRRQGDHARAHRMIDDRVRPVPPHAELRRRLRRAADKRNATTVDAVAEHREDRGQQRESGEDGREDADGAGVAERSDEGDLRDGQREECDDHGAAGKQHGTTTRREHLWNRLAGMQAVLAHQLAMLGDEEQRVVDADPEADHRGERRPDRRDAGEVPHQADQRGADEQTEHRGQDRQAHRDQRREGEREDDHRREQADQLARLGALRAECRADHAADVNLHPGGAPLLHPHVEDALRRRLAERAAADVEQHGDERVVAVLADEAGRRVRERVRHRVDVLHLLQRVVGVGDRLLVLAAVLDLALRVEDDRAAAVLLRREVLRQEVGGRLAARARQREVVVGQRADPADHQRAGDDRDDPEDDHEPAVADADVPERVEHAS